MPASNACSNNSFWGRLRLSGFVAIPERSASGKAIDEIELEYFAMRIDVQPVEVGAQVAAQDGELGLAVLLDRRWGMVRMPLKVHRLSPPSTERVSHCARLPRAVVRAISA